MSNLQPPLNKVFTTKQEAKQLLTKYANWFNTAGSRLIQDRWGKHVDPLQVSEGADLPYYVVGVDPNYQEG